MRGQIQSRNENGQRLKLNIDYIDRMQCESLVEISTRTNPRLVLLFISATLAKYIEKKISYYLAP
jgi:hypothetical protein